MFPAKPAKWIITMVLFLVLIMLPCFSFADDRSGDFNGIHWELDNRGTLTFTSDELKELPKSGPWSVYIKDIKTIVVGKGITKLQHGSFDGCSNLSTILLGCDVEELGTWVFMNCRKVNKLILQMTKECFRPDFITSHVPEIELGDNSPYVIENGLLYNKNKDSVIYGPNQGTVIIPQGVTTIAESAFADSKITGIVLPDTMTHIKEKAFESCSNLQQIVFPKSLQSVGNRILAFCSKIKKVEFLGETIVFDNNSAYELFRHCESLEEIVLPKSEFVPALCFADCRRLKKVIICDGATKIQYGAFVKCPNLKEIYIPDSVTEIDDSSIEYTAGLQICCHEGSYAESFARDHGYTCKLIKPVNEIILSDSTATIQKGKTVDLKASIEPKDATNIALEWVSSDESIATVNNGKVKAITCGECDIICKATDGSGVQAICHVSVIQMVQNIQVKEKKVTIPYGETAEPVITITPEDATNKDLEWTSSDETVCTVVSGKITAVGAGDCEITCATTDGSNKNVKLSVHVPIFDSVESTHSVTEKDGLVIPVDLHGFDLGNISHKANNENFFLYYLDDSGLHIFPIKAGKAAITLTSNINKADKAVYNIVVEDTAVYNSNESEPLRAFVAIDKASVIPGEKVKISYYISGGTAPYSTCVVDYVSSNRTDKSGSYSSESLKKLPYGNLTPTVYGGYATDLYYARINVVDANGQMISIDSNTVKVASLDFEADCDIFVAKKGEPLNLNYRISGGSGQYSIDVKGTIYDNASYSSVSVDIYKGNSDSSGVIDYIPQAGDQFTIHAEVYDQKNKKLVGYLSTPIFVISDEISMRVRYDKEELSVGEELTAYIEIDGTQTDIIDYASWSVSYAFESAWVTEYEKVSDGIWKTTITPAEKGFVQFHPNIEGAAWLANSSKWIEVK